MPSLRSVSQCLFQKVKVVLIDCCFETCDQDIYIKNDEQTSQHKTKKKIKNHNITVSKLKRDETFLINPSFGGVLFFFRDVMSLALFFNKLSYRFLS